MSCNLFKNLTFHLRMQCQRFAVSEDGYFHAASQPQQKSQSRTCKKQYRVHKRWATFLALFHTFQCDFILNRIGTISTTIPVKFRIHPMILLKY